MRRGLALLIFGLISAAVYAFWPGSSELSVAQTDESTSVVVNPWVGTITSEVVDEQRTFLRGHPCEKQALRASTYPSEISTFGRPIWTLPPKYEEIESACGFETEAGFTDGIRYSPSNSGGRAYSIESSGINEFYPNSTVLSLSKPNVSRATAYITYSTANIVDGAQTIHKAPDWTQRRTLTKRLGSASLWPGATVIKMSNVSKTETYAHGVSENGRYIAFTTFQYGTFLYDTQSRTYTTISLNSYHSTASEGGYFSVANDGGAVLHVATSIKTPGSTSAKRIMSLYDTSGCAQTLSASDYKTTTIFSTSGCREIDLTSKVFAVLGNDSATIYNTVNNAYFHPRGRYFQFQATVKPRVGTSPYVKKTVRFTSDLIPGANGYLALGDSFSSGEGDMQGDMWYEPGTDEQGDKDTFLGRNLCHVSRRSYPYLLAKVLGYLDGGLVSIATPPNDGDFHSVACSGAVIHNVVGGAPLGESQDVGDSKSFGKRDNQYRFERDYLLGAWQQGPTAQINSLNGNLFAEDRSRIFSPEVITLGIGGNDVDFGKRIKTCILDVADTCAPAVAGSSAAYHTALELVNMKSKLTKAYNQVKRESAEGTKIYVHGYPVFVSADGTDCSVNVILDPQERIYVEQGVLYFNKIVEAAAKEAGVFYIEVGDILDGVNLCSGAGSDTIAVNGITKGNDKTNSLYEFIANRNVVTRGLCMLSDAEGCGIGNESFHPNPRAHVRYAQRIFESTLGFSADMPEAQPTDIPLPNPIQFGQVAYDTVASFNAGTNIPVVSAVNATINRVEVAESDNIFILQADRVAPSSIVRVEVHSDPIEIGEYTVDSQGQLSENITIPADLPPGLHNIVITGVDEFGEAFEIQEPILVSQQAGDFDGDGVSDTEDSCVTVQNSGIDADEDGIDDVCDTEVMLQAIEEIEELPEEETIDGNIIKGEPNPETVAGTDDEFATLDNSQGVLGASTGVVAGADTLQNAGSPIKIQIIVGLGVAMISVIVIISTMTDKNKYRLGSRK